MANNSARFRLKQDEIEILMQYRGIKEATDEAGVDDKDVKHGWLKTKQASLFFKNPNFKAEAMDIKIDAKGFHFIKDKLEFDQLIWEFGNEENPSWVHVSYSSKNRKQVLKATKKNGKTIYSNY